MQDNSITIQTNSNHGGARSGAGRPKRDSKQVERWMSARGINPLHASEILSKVVDERALWRRVLSSDDDRVVLTALTFLVSMRDGKPAQQINVISQSISVSVDDIAKARAIVRELSQGSPDVRREDKANALMLCEDGGGKSGG